VEVEYAFFFGYKESVDAKVMEEENGMYNVFVLWSSGMRDMRRDLESEVRLIW
jgi:hypothetical protein